MKKINISNSLRLVAVLNKGMRRGEDWSIDYYITYPGARKPLYAFTRRYTYATYALCKDGIRINELLTYKDRNDHIMKLVGQTKKMIPYLADEYELKMAA